MNTRRPAPVVPRDSAGPGDLSPKSSPRVLIEQIRGLQPVNVGSLARCLRLRPPPRLRYRGGVSAAARRRLPREAAPPGAFGRHARSPHMRSVAAILPEIAQDQHTLAEPRADQPGRTPHPPSPDRWHRHCPSPAPPRLAPDRCAKNPHTAACSCRSVYPIFNDRSTQLFDRFLGLGDSAKASYQRGIGVELLHQTSSTVELQGPVSVNRDDPQLAFVDGSDSVFERQPRARMV